MATRLVETAPQVPGTALILLAVIAFGWGGNWPAMKVAVGEIPVFTFRVLCIAIAATALLGLTWLRGQPVGLPLKRVPTIFGLALFSVVGWQMLSALGLLFIDGGKAAIIAFTMPLWATVLSIAFLGERPTLRHGFALALGMTAIALLLGDDIVLVERSPLGGLLMLLAAFSWAIGTVLIKKVDRAGMSVTAFTGWQLVMGGGPILLGALIMDPAPAFGAWSASAWFALLFASLVGMVIGVTSYFQLLTLVPASTAAMGTLAVPVVGVLSSALLLGEAVGPAEVTALVLVLAGLALLIRR